MPLFEVTKTRSETLYVEADNSNDAMEKAREAEGSWERYKWSEPDVGYDAWEIRPEDAAEALERGEIVR
jgi:hypothetical protein